MKSETGNAALRHVMTFGKHVGKTFDWVVENDLRYAKWALQNEDPSPLMKEFADYVKEKYVLFGKYEKKTYEYVEKTDPRYLEWAQKQDSDHMGMRMIQQYIDRKRKSGEDNRLEKRRRKE